MDVDHLRRTLLSNKEIVEDAMKMDLYRYQRYGVPFSISVFYSDSSEVVDVIERFTRTTDTVAKLDTHVFCVIYGNTGYEEAFKASENILYDMKNEHPHAKVSAGMTSVTMSDIPKDMLRRALHNLGHAIKNDESSVEDDGVIDYLVQNMFNSVK
jgi:hypothetical protein